MKTALMRINLRVLSKLIHLPEGTEIIDCAKMEDDLKLGNSVTFKLFGPGLPEVEPGSRAPFVSGSWEEPSHSPEFTGWTIDEPTVWVAAT